MQAALSILFGILSFVLSAFLILLVLVQRGRGGGLSGALGGMGGQSAFGTKAGDLFTRITIVAASVWILLCITIILVMNPQSSSGRSAGPSGREFTTRAADQAASSSTSPTGPAGGAAPAEAPAPAPGSTK